MKILLLGHGKEGKSAENYFKTHFDNPKIEILKNFNPTKIQNKDFSNYDYIFRSPSVPPLKLKNETSVTKYFFDHCPCKIIGVTGTKGKGTTCLLIKTILTKLNMIAYLTGNIGQPSLDILDDLKKTDIVIYEMSSFQLWDLKKSPSVAIVLRIEPEHLDIHKNFADYVKAKSNIAKFQTKNDKIIYFNQSQKAQEVAAKSPGQKIPYPITKKSPKLLKILSVLNVPGAHNREDAEAALLAVAALLNLSLDELIDNYEKEIKAALSNFKPLPHHLEFVRKLKNIKYYDDSMSASHPSLDVALKAFPDQKIVLIAGGKDRNLDLTPMKNTIFKSKNLEKVILIGETKAALSKNENPEKYEFAETLKDAVEKAKNTAENTNSNIVLLSPGAASFDMFKDFYDRGDQFKQIVKELK